MQFVATLERRRRGSMYSSRAWPSAGRLRDTPFRSCRLFQDYLSRERESVIALLGGAGRAARPDGRRWPDWAQAQLTQDSFPWGTVPCVLRLPGRCVCLTHLVVFPCTQALMCVRTRRAGTLCVKTLEGSAESMAWPEAGCALSAPCLSVEVEALHLLEELKAHPCLGWLSSSHHAPRKSEWPGETVEAGLLATNKQKDVLGWVFSWSKSVFSMHF